MKLLPESLLVGLLTSTATAQFVLYPYSSGDGSAQNPIGNVQGFGGDEAPISDACGAALNATIDCDPLIQSLAAVSYFATMTSAGPLVCTTSCASSLVTYHSNVVGVCGDTPIYQDALNTWKGDILWNFYNMSCQKDPATGVYCPDFLLSQVSGSGVSDPLSLPADDLCSPCQLGLWQSMQSSAYAGYDDYAASIWATIQTKCGLSQPIQPLPSGLNLTIPNIANTSSTASTTCLSNKFHNVSAEDTCQSIPIASSVNSGSLRIINGLFPGCTNLAAGQSLCLPESCETYIMTLNDTCYSVAAAQNVPYAVFMSYNPTFNSDCSNTDLIGTVVCLSPPSAPYTPTTIAGAVPTQTGAYASAAIPPPGTTAFKTTLNCGSWYPVQPGDYCSIISLTNSISLELFLLINPSVDVACDNLVPGLFYCTQPTADWNITNSNDTASQTTIPPPGPTPSGTVGMCYAWHTIMQNDTCNLLEAAFGITFAELVAWNPSLDANCLNLMLNESYCIAGPGAPAPTTSVENPSSASLSSKSSTTASPTSTPRCSKDYTVVSGDTCFSIWTTQDITQAQLLAWNPTLDADCDIQVGQVLCVGVVTAGPVPGVRLTESSPATTTGGTSTSSVPPTASSALVSVASYTPGGTSDGRRSCDSRRKSLWYGVAAGFLMTYWIR